MSQRALGDALGLGKRTGSTRINRYERLASECDFDTARRIAATLEVPLAYLFAETDELAEAISQLLEQQIGAIISIRPLGRS